MRLIFGLGQTGQSFLNYLQRLPSEKQLKTIAFDTRAAFDLAPLQKMFPHVDFYQHEFPADFVAEITEVWISPGISPKTELVQQLTARDVPIKSDIQVFAEGLGEQSPKIITITGTNGKSTVTTLVTQMLNQAGLNAKLAGNIGIPVLDLFSAPLPDYVVIELSSFQAHYTHNIKTDTAVLLNIDDDHADWHGSHEAYVEAKRKSLSFAEIGLNWSKQHLSTHQASALTAFCCGVSDSVMVSVLANFNGLPHRCEIIAEQDGVTWVNDSKATNIHAACYAMDQFAKKHRVILIAGGLGKGQDFTPFAQKIVEHNVKVLLIGQDAPLIAAAIDQQQGSYQIVHDLDVAVEQARELANSGDVVLLSPACASFDQFKSFEDRGAQFKALTLLQRDPRFL